VQYGETQMKLYYNDYNTYDANKASGIVRICGPIFHAGNLDGIGMQEHDGASSPTPAQWKASYTKFDTVCSEMAVTEFDVTTSSYTPAGLAAQARQVGALLKCFVEKSARSGRGKIVNFTKDGLNDRYTFNINSSLWDSTDQCKPSFYAAAAVGIHYNALDLLIASADTLQEARFTPESWAAMTAALNFAKGAMARDYSSSVSAADTLAQADVALKAALDGLVLTGVGEPANNGVPRTFALWQNYPNPFNPKTVISYQLSVVSEVRLEVYDLLGREVAELVNEKQPAGRYSVAFDAGRLASGTYIYRIVAGTFVDSKTMLLVK
jgi:hypothetical protein